MGSNTSPETDKHQETLLERAVKRQLAMMDQANALPQPYVTAPTGQARRVQRAEESMRG